MSILSKLNIFNKIADIAGEAITDKDKQNELLAHLAEIKEQAYITELNTKTIPWVDAIHKMGRQILSLLSLLVPAVLLYLRPEIDPLGLAALVAPGGIYNYIKGKGR